MLMSAEEAGCTFTFSKDERMRYGRMMRNRREAEEISSQLREQQHDARPRLVKKGQ